MLIDSSMATRLKNAVAGDAIEINGEMFRVASVHELHDFRKFAKSKETRSEGAEILLRGDISGCSLIISDTLAEYERIAILDGPAPMNSNPMIIFVQDSELGKTYKYAITRHQVKEICVRFLKDGNEIGLKSLNVP